MITRKMAVLAVGATLAAGAGQLALLAPAQAAQSTLQLTCSDGGNYTVRTNDNHSSEHGGWGVGQIVAGGSGHGIPTSFAGSLFDVATNQTIFSFEQAKAGGQANRNQQTITCTGTQNGTLGDFSEPGDQLPPGTSASDPVVFTLTVTVVMRP